jgi:hypothetical protein
MTGYFLCIPPTLPDRIVVRVILRTFCTHAETEEE